MLRDELMTYRKEVESYLMATSNLGIVQLDTGLAIQGCNIGFMRLFSPRQNPVGEPLTDYLEIDTNELRCGELLRLSCSRKSGIEAIIYCHLIRTENGYLLFCERQILTESRALEQIGSMNDELINLQRDLVKKNHLLEKMTRELQAAKSHRT
jgi:hypothetical protein